MRIGQNWEDYERTTTRRYFIRELNAKGYSPPQIAKALLSTNKELFPTGGTVINAERLVSRDLQWIKRQLRSEIFRGNLKEKFEERLIDFIDQQKELFRQGLVQGKLDISMSASQNIARALGVNTNPVPGIVINNTNTSTILNVGTQAAKEFQKAEPETKERIWQAIEDRYANADDRN